MHYAFCDRKSDVNAVVKKSRNDGLSLVGLGPNNSSRIERGRRRQNVGVASQLAARTLEQSPAPSPRFTTRGDVMLLFQLREPINAWSHGAGMLLAIPVTWFLWKRCVAAYDCGNATVTTGLDRVTSGSRRFAWWFSASPSRCATERVRVFHGARLSGEPLTRLQRLDHVGIYLLIAGTYTPVAWGLMRGPWLWGTLTAAWTTAIVCGTRVLCGDLMPMWLSTLTYLVMGWGALFCYNELARTHSHRKLLLLPLGGLFYSVGAVMNLMHWPALVPGVFAAHEIFHFFVISGHHLPRPVHAGRRHPLARTGPAAFAADSPVALNERPRLPTSSQPKPVWPPHFSWRAWVTRPRRSAQCSASVRRRACQRYLLTTPSRLREPAEPCAMKRTNAHRSTHSHL